jgi:hypothetical protein
MLRTSVVPQHLRDVTRFIELAEIVRFADRVLGTAAMRVPVGGTLAVYRETPVTVISSAHDNQNTAA